MSRKARYKAVASVLRDMRRPCGVMSCPDAVYSIDGILLDSRELSSWARQYPERIPQMAAVLSEVLS